MNKPNRRISSSSKTLDKFVNNFEKLLDSCDELAKLEQIESGIIDNYFVFLKKALIIQRNDLVDCLYPQS